MENAQRSRRAHGIYETHEINGNQTHKSYWSYRSHSVAEPTIQPGLNPAYTSYITLLAPTEPKARPRNHLLPHTSFQQ